MLVALIYMVSRRDRPRIMLDRNYWLIEYPEVIKRVKLNDIGKCIFLIMSFATNELWNTYTQPVKAFAGDAKRKV